jgi:CubicO group peptidase (beta-lactamase class C family)
MRRPATCLLCISLLAATSAARADDALPVPRFTDPDRTAKLESALPDIDRLFRDYAVANRIPGMVWGVVIDGRLAHTGTAGVRELSTQSPIAPTTVFRIASMTKSFTALAVLKLRDAHRLSLEDPVSKWLPEWSPMHLPTLDTAPLRIRELLSHSAGLPEDNPWGDQQLAASDADLTRWLRRGIPFSNAPDTHYEYSNYAYALLGRIITRASGVPYERYMRREILAPLHMDTSTFEFADVPTADRAIGYRLQPDGSYREEPPLPHGAFGAMGGLLTSAADLGRFVVYLLSAWPARDDPDAGPVRRSSIREMGHLWAPSNLTALREAGVAHVTERGYGYGLRVWSDCRFEHLVGHGGGLPGFGSYMAWLPDHGVGMFAMATLTYSGPSEAIDQAWNVLLRTGGLKPRELPASPILTQMREHILRLWQSWDDAGMRQIAAMNLLIDEPLAQRRAEVEALKAQVGECRDTGPMRSENWLRGQFNLACANGNVGVFFSLSPTQPPEVQYLHFERIDSDQVRLEAPTGPATGVSCTL